VSGAHFEREDHRQCNVNRVGAVSVRHTRFWGRKWPNPFGSNRPIGKFVRNAEAPRTLGSTPAEPPISLLAALHPHGNSSKRALSLSCRYVNLQRGVEGVGIPTATPGIIPLNQLS
jgi:hypothetical protein